MKDKYSFSTVKDIVFDFFKNKRNLKAICVGVLSFASLLTLANVSTTLGKNTYNAFDKLADQVGALVTPDSKEVINLEVDTNVVPNYGTTSIMNYSISTSYRETAIESTAVYTEDNIFYAIDSDIYSDYMSIIGYDKNNKVVKNYKIEKPSIDANATKTTKSEYTDYYDNNFGKMKFLGFESGQQYNYLFYVGPQEIMWYFYGDENNYTEGHLTNPTDKNAYMVIKYDKEYNELQRWDAPYAFILDGYDTFPDVDGIEFHGSSLGNCPGHTSGQIIESTDGSIITMISANNGANSSPSEGGKHQTEWTWSLYTEDFNLNNPSYNHSFPYTGFRQNIPGANHSFGQHMYYDEGNGQIASVSLGDKYPRGVILQAPNTTNSDVKTNVLYEIPDIIPAYGSRYQETNTNIGSFVINKDTYMTSLNRTIDFNSYKLTDTARNLYLYVTTKDGYYCHSTDDKSLTKEIRITDFNPTEGGVSLPYLVRISDDRSVLMWQEFKSDGNGNILSISDLKYCVLDNYGNIKQAPRTADGMSLSAFHEPVYDKNSNTIFWYNNISQTQRELYRLKVK